MNPTLVKSFIAGGAIGARALVKFGSADGTVVAATAATDSIVGVCVQPGGAGSGDRVDVAISGIAEIKFGGTVTRGGTVTANSDSEGVAPAPAAGVVNRIVGIALQSTSDGDIGDVLLAQGEVQGAGLS